MEISPWKEAQLLWSSFDVKFGSSVHHLKYTHPYQLTKLPRLLSRSYMSVFSFDIWTLSATSRLDGNQTLRLYHNLCTVIVCHSNRIRATGLPASPAFGLLQTRLRASSSLRATSDLIRRIFGGLCAVPLNVGFVDGQRVGCGSIVAEVVVTIAIRDHFVGHREAGCVVYTEEVLFSTGIGQPFILSCLMSSKQKKTRG